MKIHLVDGTYELFRNHFGAPSRTAPDGREVGATLGLLRSLLMLLTTPGVTHVACAFDHGYALPSRRGMTSIRLLPATLFLSPLSHDGLSAN